MHGYGWLSLSVLVGQAGGPLHLLAAPTSKRSSGTTEKKYLKREKVTVSLLIKEWGRIRIKYRNHKGSDYYKSRFLLAFLALSMPTLTSLPLLVSA